MTSYSVTVTTRPAPGTPRTDWDTAEDGPGDKLMAALEPYEGAVSTGPDEWSATVTVAASMALHAASSGTSHVLNAARRSGMPLWPVVGIEVNLQEDSVPATTGADPS